MALQEKVSLQEKVNAQLQRAAEKKNDLKAAIALEQAARRFASRCAGDQAQAAV